MGAEESQYQDVVSELHTPRPLRSVVAPLVCVDGASLPRWHLTSPSPENDISEPDYNHCLSWQRKFVLQSKEDKKKMLLQTVLKTR